MDRTVRFASIVGWTAKRETRNSELHTKGVCRVREVLEHNRRVGCSQKVYKCRDDSIGCRSGHRSARELMSYLGLTSSKYSRYSSSEKKRKGGNTRTENSHLRRSLVESAWAYHYRPAVQGSLKKRRVGQPAAVIAIADRAQKRLYRRYYKLKEQYRKPHNTDGKPSGGFALWRNPRISE